VTPDERLPSQVDDQPWVWAERSADGTRPDDGGKWLVYRRPGHELDEAWQIIRAETRVGGLGSASKAATGMIGHGREGDAVICVYTQDWLDRRDVARVLVRLRVLGFAEMLSYKRDAATAALDYSRGVAAYVSPAGSDGFEVRKKGWDAPKQR
jgi:hypothetical protein